MQQASPQITRQTTMWNAWIGFNATHSLGLILFGTVYGYLGLMHSDMLFGSTFLVVLGFALLPSYALIAKRYFFRLPFRGMVLAVVLFVLGTIANWA